MNRYVIDDTSLSLDVQEGHMNTQDTLLHYGEWLDQMGFATNFPDDGRSWDDLAAEFVGQWQGSSLAAKGEHTGRETCCDECGEPDGLVIVPACRQTVQM